MRRWAMIAAFVLALAAIPAMAQRGGGHASGGRGDFSGHVGSPGHFGGMRSGASMAARGFTHGPGFSQRPFSQRSFPQRSFRQGRLGFRGERFRDRRFHNFRSRNCFGCRRWGFGYPWGYAGFYDPYWWWDSGSSYDEDRAQEIALANQMNEQSLEQQRMREEGDQDLYARSPAPAAPQRENSESAPSENTPPTVLVFRDQRKQEVQNYAIVGQTLWNFSPQHTQKIPLADLDLVATMKANEERGVDFRVPNSLEGQ